MHAHMINLSFFDLEKVQTSINAISSYEWHDTVNAPKHDNMHNNDVNMP